MKQENKIVRFIVELESDNLAILENQEITVIKKINNSKFIIEFDNSADFFKKAYQTMPPNIIDYYECDADILSYLKFKNVTQISNDSLEPNRSCFNCQDLVTWNYSRRSKESSKIDWECNCEDSAFYQESSEKFIDSKYKIAGREIAKNCSFYEFDRENNNIEAEFIYE